MLKRMTILLVVTLSVTGLATDPYKNFDRGWELYQKGLYDTAARLVDEALGANLNEHLRANYLYLKGHVLIKKGGDLLEARDTFLEARDHYQALNDDRLLRDILHCEQGLARVYIDLEEFGHAKDILDRLKKNPDLEGQLGYVYYLSAKIAFLEDKYEVALSDSRHSLEEYKSQESVRGMADARLNISRNLIILEQYDEGLRQNMEAQREIIEVGDPNKHFYTLINQLMYNRCTNKGNGQHIVKMIETHLKAKPDKDLQFLLDFALDLCAS